MAGKRLTHLKPIHEIAARMRLEGKSYDQIEERLGVRRGTLYRWFCQPIIKEYMQRLSDEIHDEFRARMAGIGVAALERMSELLTADTPQNEGPTVEQQIEIAQDLMDRVPGLAKGAEGNGQPSGMMAGGNINMLNFGEMEDEDLIKLARSMAGEIASAAKPQLESGD